MGCGSSKVDDLPAVGLCRERCSFLDEAIHQRYALAAAHLAYINSLKAIGHSLHLFIQQDRDLDRDRGLASSSPSPSPPHKKNLTAKHASPSPSPSLSHSNSGSHLQFHSDSEEDDNDLHHHSTHSSPYYYHHHNHNNISESDHHHNHLSFPSPSPSPSGHGHAYNNNSNNNNIMHMNFMKNKPTSSIVYEQRPMSPDSVYVGESSSSSSSYPYYPYQYPPSSSSYNPYSMPPTTTPPPSSYSSYGSSYPPPPPASSSKPPPPPPSPPRSSPWDFLNLFNNDDNYYSQYTPSRDSKEVREEEGIPDLEDEDYHYQHEVVKEVHGDPKLVDAAAAAAASSSSSANPNHQQHNNNDNEAEAVEDEEGVEYEVHVVDKKVVDDDHASKDRPPAFPARPPPGGGGSRNPIEIAKEIELQFQRASDSGSEIANMLEVAKHPYNRKHAPYYQASSKMLHVVAPSLSVVSSRPSTSKSAESTSTAQAAAPPPPPPNLDFDIDLAIRSRNLSSTLHKLYLWEKKLYNEVKAEEKMRLVHDRKCLKLKRLDERGADFHKVDATRALIKSLSTKIRMAIQVVDKISMTINKIRDEELWPQLKELIQGLTRMWKSMLECHHCQCEAIREARILGSVGSRKKGGDGHLMATKQLEQELINWTFQFSSWISAQKGYVRALNNWLLKCLLYEPEETPDGIVPFSPGRIGAPPIFVICNQWSQALDRISEKEVVDSMHVFTMSVLQVWEQDKLEMHRQMMENKDLERKVRNLDRDDQRLQKQIQALERKVVLASGEGKKGLSVSENIIYQSDKSSSLQASLQRIFEAMERFTDESVRVYEELLQRSVEESATRDHEGVP